MDISCNVIKDLIPIYVDDICSEETKKMVEEHVQNCKGCRDFLQLMKFPVDDVVLEDKNEVLKAQKPFKKINKIHFIKITVAVILAVIITMISMLVITNVGYMYDFLFPQQVSVIDEKYATGEWENIFIENNEYLNYNSIFYNKTVTNHANSTSTIKMRILGSDKKSVLYEFEIEAGTSVKLKRLKNNTDYIVQILADEGWYALYFH